MKNIKILKYELIDQMKNIKILKYELIDPVSSLCGIRTKLAKLMHCLLEYF